MTGGRGRGGDRVDAVVVGGGLAGLAAALELADAGCSVALVERRRRLGGLTWSFERGGLSFDNGQHVFLRCCDAYRGFLGRIGATGDVVLQDRLSVPVVRPGGRSATIARRALPAPLHLAGAMARYGHLSLADRVRLGPAIAALRRLDPDDPALDGETFGHWLARHHQRQRAVEALWDLITLPTVNLPAAEASLAMGVKVFRTGLLDTADGADIGWAAVPLGVLHGERAASALAAAGVELVTGARVTALDPDPDGWRLSIDGGAALVAGAVVLAVPPTVAADLAPAGALPPLARLGTSPIVDVQLVLDRRVTDLPLFAAVDSPVQYVFDRTATAGLDPRRGQVLALSLSGADTLVGCRPADLVARFTAALGTLLPGMARARVVDAVVTKEQAATFRATPGSAALRPSPGVVAPGLAVAGAWCATGWPATMEGAVRAGRSAAAALLPAATAPLPAAGARDGRGAAGYGDPGDPGTPATPGHPDHSLLVTVPDTRPNPAAVSVPQEAP